MLKNKQLYKPALALEIPGLAAYSFAERIKLKTGY